MTTSRRVNVASGRQLERLAHYSRALRVGDTVLQSGTTAIDRQGNVRGEGSVAEQVDAIMRIAAWSMGKAGGRLADVVRSRIYVTDIAVADQAARAVARHFRDARPAATLVQVNRLARPAQLIEIELDAVDGAGQTAQRISSGGPLESHTRTRGRSGSGTVCSSPAPRRSTRVVASTRRATCTARPARPWTPFSERWPRPAARPGTSSTAKTFLTDLGKADEYTRAWLEALGDVRPTSTLLGIPALVRPELLVEIEAEAVLGAARSRRDIYTEHMREKPRGYARAVEVGDLVYVAGCTSLSSTGEIRAAGDWAAQDDLAHETIRWALGQAGASLDDVVRRRTFTVDGAEQNRPYGQGPAWFAKSCPTSLGCRIAGLARPELLVEVEVAAVKGAHAGIEWVGPDAVDPLDAAGA